MHSWISKSLWFNVKAINVVVCVYVCVCVCSTATSIYMAVGTVVRSASLEQTWQKPEAYPKAWPIGRSARTLVVSRFKLLCLPGQLTSQNVVINLVQK